MTHFLSTNSNVLALANLGSLLALTVLLYALIKRGFALTTLVWKTSVRAAIRRIRYVTIVGRIRAARDLHALTGDLAKRFLRIFTGIIFLMLIIPSELERNLVGSYNGDRLLYLFSTLCVIFYILIEIALAYRFLTWVALIRSWRVPAGSHSRRRRANRADVWQSTVREI